MRITRFAGIAVVLAALLAVPLPPSASADPGSQAELRKLTKQAAQLNKLYRGQIQSLEEVRIQAKKATETADRLKSQLANARGDVAGIAATSYMTGPLDNIQLFTNPMEPYQLLGQAANLRYMADERTQRVVQIQTLIKKAAEAKKASDQKIKELQRELKTMQSKRRDVEKLLAKYGFQTPTGGEGLTQRMTSVKITVMQNFPMPYGGLPASRRPWRTRQGAGLRLHDVARHGHRGRRRPGRRTGRIPDQERCAARRDVHHLEAALLRHPLGRGLGSHVRPGQHHGQPLGSRPRVGILTGCTRR